MYPSNDENPSRKMEVKDVHFMAQGTPFQQKVWAVVSTPQHSREPNTPFEQWRRRSLIRTSEQLKPSRPNSTRTRPTLKHNATPSKPPGNSWAHVRNSRPPSPRCLILTPFWVNLWFGQTMVAMFVCCRMSARTVAWSCAMKRRTRKRSSARTTDAPSVAMDE